MWVLNLIINGLSSKPLNVTQVEYLYDDKGFKPYYKWTIF